MIPYFACILKTGGDYGMYDVLALKKQVDRNTTLRYCFKCFTDHTGLLNQKEILISHYGIIVEELPTAFPGWWSVMNVFNLRGSVIATGLDTVIVGNIDKLFYLSQKISASEFGLIKSFNPKQKYGLANGIMIWNGDYTWIYKDFCRKAELYMQSYHGEMNFSIGRLVEENVKIFKINDVFEGIYSYKHHCRGKNRHPDNASVVLFHGKPRPNECNERWVIDARK